MLSPFKWQREKLTTIKYFKIKTHTAFIQTACDNGHTAERILKHLDVDLEELGNFAKLVVAADNVSRFVAGKLLLIFLIYNVGKR